MQGDSPCHALNKAPLYRRCLAVRPIAFKLTKGNAPDTAQMNAKVREMIKESRKHSRRMVYKRSSRWARIVLVRLTCLIPTT